MKLSAGILNPDLSLLQDILCVSVIFYNQARADPCLH